MRKYCSFFLKKKNQADDLIFPFKRLTKNSYKFVYQSILKKTTVHENRKTEDNFAPESTHGILNTNRRQFLFLEFYFTASN
jgi:hypothetical protein